MSWPIGKVSDVADVISGYAFKSTWFDEGDDKVVRIGDLQNGRVVTEACKTIKASNHRISETYRIREGDILMALSGATVGKVAVADVTAAGAFLNQRVAIIRGKNKTNAAFIKYVFSGHLLDTLLLSAGGAAQPNLSPKKLAELEIPIPPLDEQKRIAAILDKADGIRQKRKQAVALADDFLRSVFLDMFGDPVTNPKGFPVGKIGDLVESAKYGSSAKASEADGEYPILRMGNLTYQGSWDFTSLKYIDLEAAEEAKYLVHKGDLLFNRTNSKDLVGKTAVYEETKPMAFAGYLVRVRPNESGNNYYISGYLNSKHGKQTLRGMCKSIVGMANINAKELQSIRILCPPVGLQNEYERLVKAVKERVAKQTNSDAELLNLFSALSQKAFSGQL